MAIGAALAGGILLIIRAQTPSAVPSRAGEFAGLAQSMPIVEGSESQNTEGVRKGVSNPQVDADSFGWERVGPSIALYAPALQANRLKPGMFDVPWLQFISDLQIDALYGAAQPENDLKLRAAGYVIGIDSAILRTAGFQLARAVPQPPGYFPSAFTGIPGPPLDASQAEATLRGLVAQPEAAMEHVPARFRADPHLATALRARSILLWSSFAKQDEVVTVCGSLLADPDLSPSLRDAAATALLRSAEADALDGRISESLRSWVSQGLSAEDPSRALAILACSTRQGRVSTDPWHAGEIHVPLMLGNRWSDEMLLGAARVSDPRHRADFVETLACRADNPLARRFVLEALETSPDPQVAARCFRYGLGMLEDRAFQAGIRRWLRGDSEYAKLWALSALGCGRSEDHLVLVEPMLTGTSEIQCQVAIMSLLYNGGRDPKTTRAVVAAAAKRHPQHPGIEIWSQAVIQRMKRIERSPEAFQNTIRQRLENGWLRLEY